MKPDFRRRTEKLRHGTVKLIAPKLYFDVTKIDSLIGAIPRPMTLFLKDHFKKSESLIGAEIGVDKAQNSISILQELPIRKLFLIDPYVSYVENGRPMSYENSFNTAKERLSRYGQVQFIRKTSEEAAKDIEEPLDFVYADGNHSYGFVKSDIQNYYPLLRKGGVIGGHDYTPFRHLGVVKAVDEFLEVHGRIGFYAVFPDWWIIK